MSSIYSRFTKLYIILGVIAVFCIAIINIFTLQYFIKPNEISKASTVADMVIGDIAAPMQLGLLDSVQKQIFKEQASNQNIVYIVIKDFASNTVFSAGKIEKCDGFLIESKIYDTVDKNHLGSFEMCYSNANYNYIFKIQTLVVLLMSLFVFIVTVAMLAILQKFISPFRALAGKLEQFNPTKPTPIEKVLTNSYEIQIIQDAVLGAIEQLVHYQLWLEHEVNIRTKELDGQKKVFQTLTESSPNPVLMYDTKVQYANPAFLQLSGFNADDINDITLAEILMLEQPELSGQIFAHHDDAFCARYSDAYLLCKSKVKIPVALSLASLIVDGKTVFIVNITDLSELKRKDTILLAQSRFAAMGEMIANIAHQWRQPLNVIQGSITQAGLFSQIGILTGEELQKSVEEIKAQVGYLSSTIDDFRNYYRLDTDSEFMLHDALQKACALVYASFANNFVALDFINKSEDILINGSLNKFIQAIISILNNAKDAIIELNVDDKLTVLTLEKIDNSAIITIQDSGGGIKDDIIAKIFEPYFTTKSKAQGTGIGLYMSKQIIESSFNGSVIASNLSFEHKNITYFGAAFTIKLPIGEQNP